MQTSRDQLNIEVSPQEVSPCVMPQPIVEQPRTNENGADNQVYKDSSNSFESINYFKTLDQLLIKQVHAAFENCRSGNIFQVKNCLNQQLFLAIEESECCARFCLATGRGFALRIFDNFRNEVIRLERPTPWCVDGIKVYSPPGTLIGKVRPVCCSCGSTQFVIKDATGNIVFQIKRPNLKTKCCGCSSPDELPYRIQTEDGSEIGNITNLHPSTIVPIPDDSDKYKITFPLDIDVTRKILILGSCFLMDATMFERNQDSLTTCGGVLGCVCGAALVVLKLCVIELIMALRWGIVSSGRICHDFVTAVQTYPENDHIVVAIAARSLSSAQKFAKNHNIPRAYEGYEGIAQDKDVDIVYLGNLNPQHFEVSKMMLEHGKHVLCEKPLTMNEKQARKLVKIAQEKKLFLMEAVWSRCFPAYKEMKRLLDSGAIGEVLFASVHFGHALQHVERLKAVELGGGAILDLGVYILQFQQYVFRGLRPLKIVVNGHLNDQKTDESAAIIITYPDGKMAVVSTSARISLPNEGVVVGTKGTIKMPDFWCPTQLITPEKIYNYELPKTHVPFFHKNSAGLAFQAEEARQCIKAGKIQSPHMPHDESIELAQLMDLMRKEVGVVFPQDFE